MGKVRERIQAFFNGKNLHVDLNADESIAQGASILAAQLTGRYQMNFQNCASASIGIARTGKLQKVGTFLGFGGRYEVKDDSKGVMEVMIAKNDPLPRSVTKTLTTSKDKQTSMCIEVFEGENSRTEDNRSLGVFELEGIPERPCGKLEIQFTFELDMEGRLKVFAKYDGISRKQMADISMVMTTEEYKQIAERMKEDSMTPTQFHAERQVTGQKPTPAPAPRRVSASAQPAPQPGKDDGCVIL